MVGNSWPAAIVFDFDGLLMDTESTSLESWRHEWEQWDLTLDRSTFFAEHGGDLTEARYAELALAVGPSYDRTSSHARRVAYRETLHAELALAAGIREWIVEAMEWRLRLAVGGGHSSAVPASPVCAAYSSGTDVERSWNLPS